MTGRQVKHVTFGIGSIIGYESGKIAVDFSGTIRLFQFPESFGRFLITDDIVLQGMVADAIKEKEAIKQKAEEERQIPKDPNALQVTHTASDAPFTEQNKTLLPVQKVQEANTGVSNRYNHYTNGSSGNWIIPCNPRYFDIIGAYDTLRTIDWRQWVKNIEPGDIVYIYVGKPFQAIMYKTRVVMTDIPWENVDTSDEPFDLEDSDSDNPDHCMRLELIKKYPPTALTFEKLRCHGLKGSLQGQRRTGVIIQSIIDEYESSCV